MGGSDLRSQSRAFNYFKYASVFGIAVLATSLVTYSSYQITRLEKKLTATNLAWQKRSAALEGRVRRDIANARVQQAQIHEVVKRQAQERPNVQAARDELVPMVTMSSGGAYTRWGRTDCTEENEETVRVYQGIMAGSYLTHVGGGSNYVCLHNDITYVDGKFVEGNQGASYIYGVEWRDTTWMYPLLNLEDTMVNAVQFHSVPCAMCIARSRYTQIMIPGQNECPVGFTVEYKGYIMAGGHSDKHPTEYICVDERPHVVPGTHGDQKGASLHMVETQCASLPCEPVVAGREIRCVVCTI